MLSSYVNEGLLLGQLLGNRFTITLRWECYPCMKSTFPLLKLSLAVRIIYNCWCDCSFIFLPTALTYFLRGIVADTEDTIKASVDALGRNGFINYFGLQVLSKSPLPHSPPRCVSFFLSSFLYSWISFLMDLLW